MMDSAFLIALVLGDLTLVALVLSAERIKELEEIGDSKTRFPGISFQLVDGLRTSRRPHPIRILS